MNSNELAQALCEPFPVNEIHFLVITSSKDGTKALVSPYLQTNSIMDRLDAVFGPGGWQDHYTVTEMGCVMCTLSVKVEGEWVDKSDFGRPSKQPEGHDKLLAACTNSLKRAAEKLGIGRYLSRLPTYWVAYDSQKKQIKERPQLPAWAVPRVRRETPAPQPEPARAMPTGAELLTIVLKTEHAWVDKKLCQTGELTKRLIEWARKEGQDRADSVVTWPAERAARVGEQMRVILKQLQEEQKAAQQKAPEPAGGDTAHTDIPF